MLNALSVEHAHAVLADARAAVAPARRALDVLIDLIATARTDTGYVYEAGRALDLIATKRLYRLRGHRTLAELLSALGISRTTAYKWRRVASRVDPSTLAELGLERAYAAARPDPKRAHQGAAEAKALAKRLRAEGLRAKVSPVCRAGRVQLQVELSPEDWSRVRFVPRTPEKPPQKRRRRRT